VIPGCPPLRRVSGSGTPRWHCPPRCRRAQRSRLGHTFTTSFERRKGDPNHVAPWASWTILSATKPAFSGELQRVWSQIQRELQPIWLRIQRELQPIWLRIQRELQPIWLQISCEGAGASPTRVATRVATRAATPQISRSQVQHAQGAPRGSLKRARGDAAPRSSQPRAHGWATQRPTLTHVRATQTLRTNLRLTPSGRPPPLGPSALKTAGPNVRAPEARGTWCQALRG